MPRKPTEAEIAEAQHKHLDRQQGKAAQGRPSGNVKEIKSVDRTADPDEHPPE